MLHLENFFEKSFALLLTTPISFCFDFKSLKIRVQCDTMISCQKHKKIKRYKGF